MNKPRPCGCKGRRSCLICEKHYAIDKNSKYSNELDKDSVSYIYCPFCKLAWPGWNVNVLETHPDHEGTPLEYEGVYVQLQFLSEAEHNQLVNGIDNMTWDLSQSGRRKQNFGPKCNFKKRKLRLGEFNGFPQFSKFVQDKFKEVPILGNFQTIEQCSLEYDPEKGASIDSHIDDCWIWGERIVTVNLLADSVLTMTYNEKSEKYNLDCVSTYPKILDNKGRLNDSDQPYKVIPKEPNRKYQIVRIPMPKRSLLVMYGSARYNWEHQILREDITERRVCLAYREFTPPYLSRGVRFDEAQEVFERARNFWAALLCTVDGLTLKESHVTLLRQTHKRVTCVTDPYDLKGDDRFILTDYSSVKKWSYEELVSTD